MIAVEIQDVHYNYYFFLILPLSRHPVESCEQDIRYTKPNLSGNS